VTSISIYSATGKLEFKALRGESTHWRKDVVFLSFACLCSSTATFLDLDLACSFSPNYVSV